MTFLALLLTAIAGLVAHWFKRYCRGQTEASFKDYMLSYKKQTLASVTSVVAAIATLYAASDSVELAGQTLSTAFLAGYVGDSALNKGPGE